jgi:hypothetical protein
MLVGAWQVDEHGNRARKIKAGRLDGIGRSRTKKKEDAFRRAEAACLLSCEEVHLNLAYRWFCRLRFDGDVPDHPTFSKNRHGRFRQSDLLRHVFETVLRRCIAEGLVGGEGFAVDASLI